jgi:hypothetical protein
MVDVELARLEKLLGPGGPKPAAPELCLSRSELRSICGTMDDAFNARLLSDAIAACSPADDPSAAAPEVMSALKDIAPASAREAMLAAQIVVTHHAALDCHRRARSPAQGRLVGRAKQNRQQDRGAGDSLLWTLQLHPVHGPSGETRILLRSGDCFEPTQRRRHFRRALSVTSRQGLMKDL